MMNQKTNYSKEKVLKRKLILAILLLGLSAILVFGVVYAYFSDISNHSGNLTSSTLNIDGEYTVMLNGNAVQSSDITNLNPGDVIVVKGSITNKGNQSAWIREKISFGTADAAIINHIKVYGQELTQAELISETDFSSIQMPIAENNVTVSGNRVINGSGGDAQVESGGSYTYLNTNTYDFVITIFFSHKATNEAQNKSFSFAIETQGLQFRNNNANPPSEDAWSAVAAV